MPSESPFWLNVITFGVLAVTTLLVYLQLRVANKATKSQIAVGLIDQLNADKLVQETLELTLADNVFFENRNGVAILTSKTQGGSKDIYIDLNIMLNRFQVLGQLFHLRVLREEDLRGLRYEIIKIGRNCAVREYLEFLNSDYQRSSGVEHDHFANFKEMYRKFEYSPVQQQQFIKCLYEYKPRVFEPRLRDRVRGFLTQRR